ncbi:MAG: CHAT domain-containing protein [Candidatus Nanopelagicales bacterium]
MNRLVFQLADSVAPGDGSAYVALSLAEPRVFGSPALPFPVTANDPPYAALVGGVLPEHGVLDAGRALYDALLVHPHLQQALQSALQTQPPARFPVLVEIATGAGAEALPWETLCAPSGDFLGLDERWAVGRVVAGPGPTPTEWFLRAPLRVAAVLSCLGVEAAGEWAALRDGLAAAPGLGTEVLAVVSEESLHAQITAEALPGVRVELVPSDVGDLQRLVAEFHPHVLHFFCHGSTEGTAHLQVAVKSDWVTGTPERSLLVEAREIRAFTRPTDDPPWVVVLNCCRSAAGSETAQLESLALKLVYDAGVPAVVGMREPVLSDDASVFSAAFYRRLATDLAARLDGTVPAEQPWDWAALVVEARTRLARRMPGLTLSAAAAATKEWSLPVVYTRPEPLLVRPGHPGEPAPGPQVAPADPEQAARAARLELQALQALAGGLPPEAPDGLRSDIAARIAELTAGLGPS